MLSGTRSIPPTPVDMVADMEVDKVADKVADMFKTKCIKLEMF